jgi:hypothetical protein|tara:strand:- start:305 stop:478 length:174 start_codon:yes stop_codon:yes gene_type:complete
MGVSAGQGQCDQQMPLFYLVAHSAGLYLPAHLALYEGQTALSKGIDKAGQIEDTLAR